MKDWKIIAIFSGIAFILSFIAGIAGEVSFAGIFIRALTGAAAFGFLAFVISYILHKFLPEIYGNEDPMEEVTVAEAGSGVDIVIDDTDDELETEVSADMDVLQKETEPELSGDVSVLPDEEEGDEEGLPNIEKFSNIFDAAAENTGEESALTGSVSVDIMGQEQDPGTVAKAIRTIMKKDQEG